MPAISAYDQHGEPLDAFELPESVLEEASDTRVLRTVVTAQLAGARQGTAKTKTRSEVKGSGRKLWRQKGTGRARVGDRRSPIWRGGGVIFGPVPRDYGMRVNRKMRRKAFKQALWLRVSEGAVCVVEDPVFEEPKTRRMASLLAALDASDAKTLVVCAQKEGNLYKAGRNIPNLRMITVDQLSPLDLLECDKAVFLRSALEEAQRRLSP